MTRNIIFLILYFTLNHSYSQDLNHLYKEAAESSDLVLAEKVKALAIDRQDQRIMADSYYLIAYLQKKESDFFNAVINYMEAAKHYRELGDFKNVAGIVENVGYIYRQSGFKNTGLKYFYDALHLNEQLGDSLEMMYVFYNIGQTYWDINKPDSALSYYSMALEISKKFQNTYAGRIYNDIGVAYRLQEKYDLALEYYDLADQFDASISMRAKTLNNRGYAHLQMGDTLAAFGYFKQALKLDLGQVDKRTLAFIYANLGTIQTKPDSAIHFYESSFSYLKDNELAMSAEYYATCKELEKQHRMLGDEDRVLYYDGLQDKFSEEMIDLQGKLQDLNLRYQVEAATWKLETQKKSEELYERNQILQYLVIALFLATVGLLVFYRRNYKSKKKESNIYRQARELKEVLKS